MYWYIDNVELVTDFLNYKFILKHSFEIQSLLSMVGDCILFLQAFYDLMRSMKANKLARRTTLPRRSTVKIEKISVSDKNDGEKGGCCVLM